MSLFRRCISRVVQNSYTVIQTRELPPCVAISSVRKFSAVPQTEQSNIIKLRGLPHRTTRDEIVKFIGDEDLIVDGKDGIFIGRGFNNWTNGVALLKLKDDTSVAQILKKDGDYIGKRYIDVILDTEEELQIFKYENSITGDITNMVKLTGVPYRTRVEDIEEFFSGLEISPNGIIFARSENAKRFGTVYVRFSSETDMNAALQKDKEYMGDRFLHIEKPLLENFLINTSCIPSNMKVQFPSCRISMQGLPWGVTNAEIEKFFAPLVPKKIHIETFQGRGTGQGHVIFNSEADAAEGLKKHNHYIGEMDVERKKER